MISNVFRLGTELNFARDDKYSSCWPAVQKDAVGVVLVYNPDVPQQSAEVEAWYQNFSRAMDMPPKQCMVIQTLREGKKAPLPNTLQALAPAVGIPNDDLVSVRSEFDRFIARVTQSVADVQRNEEDIIAGGMDA